VQKLQTAKEVWDTVCVKHEGKALAVKVDIWHWMYEMKCEDDAHVHMHLETLLRMQEQLTRMGVALTDLDLVTVILGSLPKSYQLLINAITMSATHAKIDLEPVKVVDSLLDVFEWLTI